LELTDYSHDGDSLGLGLELAMSASTWDWKMDDLAQYDDDMDAEGSPDPDYCPLPAILEPSSSSSALHGLSIKPSPQLSKGASLKDFSFAKDAKEASTTKNSKNCCTDDKGNAGDSKARACCASRASRAPTATNRNISSKLRL
jgi:hypothetical protein